MSFAIEFTDDQLDDLAIEVAKRLELRSLPQRLGAEIEVDGEPSMIAVYAVYAGRRIDAWYLPKGKSIVIGGISMGEPAINELINTEKVMSVSGSAVAIVRALKPSVDPNRNGWDFWRVAGSDERLQSIRYAD